MNPSTQEIIAAFENLPTDKIIILPNNKNIILTAEQAREVTVKQVRIIPTCNVPQGLAAMMHLNPDAELEAVSNKMESAMKDVNAIEITVNDVSLDLNGHKIQGPNTGAGTGCGIYALERYSIMVKNGRIWGFGQHGVLLSTNGVEQPAMRGAGHIVEYIQAMNNKRNGIFVDAGSIMNCTANNNAGTGGIAAYYSTVAECTTNYNTGAGIKSGISFIKNCTANNNTGHGIYSTANSYIAENIF